MLGLFSASAGKKVAAVRRDDTVVEDLFLEVADRIGKQFNLKVKLVIGLLDPDYSESMELQGTDDSKLVLKRRHRCNRRRFVVDLRQLMLINLHIA